MRVQGSRFRKNDPGLRSFVADPGLRSFVATPTACRVGALL
jgi:hypothetical protein